MDPSMPARSRFAHHLNVSESARIYQLAAASEAAATAWCTAIQNASRVLTEGDFGDEELSAELQSTIGQQAPEGHVTLVFTDVQNSTNLWEAVPDEMNQALGNFCL
jgi:class 3 adenylate cyclase